MAQKESAMRVVFEFILLVIIGLVVYYPAVYVYREYEYEEDRVLYALSVAILSTCVMIGIALLFTKNNEDAVQSVSQPTRRERSMFIVNYPIAPHSLCEMSNSTLHDKIIELEERKSEIEENLRNNREFSGLTNDQLETMKSELDDVNDAIQMRRDMEKKRVSLTVNEN